ncbi:dynein regulatory complex protein 1 [Nematolebias whitei]|uniref:dynein regulatory complex protein 1 n=1 Tax=Nematolebias whitei TaxID=451745 RepID=UPI0018992FE7|nr:dynein regulatory complex protein 1 [Nematolebias whitei]
MEVAKEEPEPPVLSDKDGTNRVSTQKDEKTSGEKKAMEEECKTRKEQEKQSQKRMIKLQRDLTAFVTNIQTAADARVVQKRTELNKAKEIRAELLENDVKSSQEKFDEFASRCSILSQKVTHPELQEALNKQQQLCAVVIQEKKKLINELQLELKLGDDRYVKDLRRNAKEIDLMIERMGDQIKIFTQAYREELAQIERVHQQELDFLLSEDTNKREQDFKELCEKELKILTERRRKVEEYEEKIHRLRRHVHSIETLKLENIAKTQDLVRKNQNIKQAIVLEKVKHQVQKAEIEDFKLSLIEMKRRSFIQESIVQKLKSTYMKEQQALTTLSHNLSEDYKRQIQKYELINMQIKHFAIADARKFKEMWSMIDADVKQLAERALLIDSVICKRLLGLSWEQPHTAVLDLSSPSQPQELVGNSDCGPETEEENVFRETQKKIKELLCNETDFLMETKVLKLLSPLENEEQTDMKLVTLLYSLELDDKDLPELTHFILKYEQQQREQTKDVCAASNDLAEAAETRATTNSASELVHPNHVLPALKSFLKHRRGRSAHHDSSENEVYWEKLGNVISEEKLRLWDEAEGKLKQYHAVLTEISDLTLETNNLKQKNAELRMQLQQRLTSTVD